VRFDARIVPLMLELLEVLRAGRRCRDRKTKGFCGRLLEVFPALWTFVAIEGMEPTNNHAERVQRRAVLWRRRSFGCQSAAGGRVVGRVLTGGQSLRLQGRAGLGFPYHAISRHRLGPSGPKVVLEGCTVTIDAITSFVGNRSPFRHLPQGVCGRNPWRGGHLQPLSGATDWLESQGHSQRPMHNDRILVSSLRES